MKSFIPIFTLSFLIACGPSKQASDIQNEIPVTIVKNVNIFTGENDLETSELLNEIKKISEAGIPLLCGTDAPNLNINYTDMLFDELELFKQAGLSNIEVLKTATTNIYRSFPLPDFDELKKGTTASFILVEGNPIENLQDLRNKKTIFKNGIKL